MAARPTELLPLAEIAALAVEQRDAVMVAVADQNTSVRVEGQRMRHVEFARAATRAAERFDELAFGREHQHARFVVMGGMVLRDENIAIRSDRHRIGLEEAVLRLAAAGLAQRHQDLAPRANFFTCMPRPSLAALSVTQTLPDASTVRPWGICSRPPPKWRSTLPSEEKQ
jgi:hypothetical protein